MEDGDAITLFPVGIFYLNNKLLAAFYFVNFENDQVTESYVYLSNNGKSYTPYRLDNNVVLGSQMAYGNGVYVSANGDDFLLPGNFPRGVFTSSDGVNWTISYTSSDVWLYDITYGNGIFVAVGSKVTVDTSLVTYEGGRVLTSSDGRTWSVHQVAMAYSSP